MDSKTALKDFTIHGTQNIPLHIYQQRDPGGTLAVPYHWHNEWEWIFVEKGPLALTIDGERTVAESGDFFFINSQELHRVESLRGISSIHHALVFSPEILQFSYEDECELRYIRPLLKHQTVFERHPAPGSPVQKSLEALFLQILEIYRLKEPGWYLEIKTCIYRVILLCSRSELLLPADSAFASRDQKGEQIKKAITFIHENYASRITLADLARYMNMNPQYFCRFFKSNAGKTPMEYLKGYRLRQACRLLQETDASILDISMQTGFESPSYFIREFRLRYGTTPGKYRK